MFYLALCDFCAIYLSPVSQHATTQTYAVAFK